MTFLFPGPRPRPCTQDIHTQDVPPSTDFDSGLLDTSSPGLHLGVVHPGLWTSFFTLHQLYPTLGGVVVPRPRRLRLQHMKSLDLKILPSRSSVHPPSCRGDSGRPFRRLGSSLVLPSPLQGSSPNPLFVTYRLLSPVPPPTPRSLPTCLRTLPLATGTDRSSAVELHDDLLCGVPSTYQRRLLLEERP